MFEKIYNIRDLGIHILLSEKQTLDITHILFKYIQIK